MAQIQISSEDVMAYSKQVDAYANEIRTVFNEIESRMYYVESIWQSPASKYFMEQFQTLNPAMMSYLDTNFKCGRMNRMITNDWKQQASREV